MTCAAGDGDCPASSPVDCVGSWSTCAADWADKVYSVTTAAADGGAECAAAAGDTMTCAAGDGACPASSPVDCVGSWSACGADCADKVYSVTTAAADGGAECAAAAGDTMTCAAGDGN